MRTDIQRFRWLSTRLPAAKNGRRLVVLTGARQTGKSTLARKQYPELRYVDLEAIEQREALRALPSAAWGRALGSVILDEAQKEPIVFEKTKYAYDEGSLTFAVLLGSSRVLLLQRVRETLAGRAFVYELWPLMASEVRTPDGEVPAPPLLDALISAAVPFREALSAPPPVLLAAEDAERAEAIEHLGHWGGMPELVSLGDGDRREWLRSYQQTFLDRDLTDLARLPDLLPFRTLQRTAMLRTAELLSYAELARDAGISAATARRYLEYLHLTYQVVLVPPFSRNLTSSAIKTPKLHWTDLGLVRQGTAQWGPLTGPMFETLVVAEIAKWVQTMGRDVTLSFYRTRSGLEVDLLVHGEAGVLAIEIKNRERVDPTDARSLRAIAPQLGAEWRGGLVVYRGRELRPLDDAAGIWAVPLHRLV